MKTAKEMCEEFKNRELNQIIRELEAWGGKYHISERIYGRSVFESPMSADTIEGSCQLTAFMNNAGLQKALTDLGYKIEFGQKTEKFYKQRAHSQTKYKNVKFLYFFNHEVSYEENFPEISFDVELRFVTISACCGEENA